MTWSFLPFELRNSSHRGRFFGILCLTLPLGIMFTFVRHNAGETGSYNGKKIFKIIAAIIFPLIFSILYIFGSFEVRHIDQFIFKNKRDTSKQIAIRYFDLESLKNNNEGTVVCIYPVNTKLYYVSTIDTLTIRKDEWVRIKDK